MIEYCHNFPLDPVDVARPTHDIARIARMFAASNLVISAWEDGGLVGVCRALTDGLQLLLLPVPLGGGPGLSAARYRAGTDRAGAVRRRG